jgi:ADP-L-glycero-D-manno-heptose 6-epimerase
MYIVTGGAGFIGSNLVRGLNRRGIEDILIVDDLEDGSKHRGLDALSFRDLVDYRDFREGLSDLRRTRVEAVLHQGACADTTERNGRKMLAQNYEYSKDLLAYAHGRCPFLYASSAAVYGDGRRGFREERACEEPLNVYGFSKLLFDNWVRRLLPELRTQVVGLRYFNVYGPREGHKGRMASVVHKFDGQVRARGELEIFAGSEGFRRDFVWVEDAVDVNLFFLLEKPGTSGIYNCGTGRAQTFAELAREVARHYPDSRVVEIPFPADLAGSYQAFTEADLGALRRAGYAREFTTLGEGVARYVDVLRNHGGNWPRSP